MIEAPDVHRSPRVEYLACCIPKTIHRHLELIVPESETLSMAAARRARGVTKLFNSGGVNLVRERGWARGEGVVATESNKRVSVYHGSDTHINLAM